MNERKCDTNTFFYFFFDHLWTHTWTINISSTGRGLSKHVCLVINVRSLSSALQQLRHNFWLLFFWFVCFWVLLSYIQMLSHWLDTWFLCSNLKLFFFFFFFPLLKVCVVMGLFILKTNRRRAQVSCLYSHMPYSKVESSLASIKVIFIQSCLFCTYNFFLLAHDWRLFLNNFEALIRHRLKSLFSMFLSHIFYILYDFSLVL